VISLDSWLKPLAQRADAAGVAARYDVETARLVVTALARRSAPLTLEVPVYDRINRAMYARRRALSIGPDDLVIVEGVPALLDDGPAGLADVRVHVEMPEAERVARVRADYRWRGMPDADIDALLASREADETGAVQEARARANFIVSAWTPA
jgi:uridine kinase